MIFNTSFTKSENFDLVRLPNYFCVNSIWFECQTGLSSIYFDWVRLKYYSIGFDWLCQVFWVPLNNQHFKTTLVFRLLGSISAALTTPVYYRGFLSWTLADNPAYSFFNLHFFFKTWRFVCSLRTFSKVTVEI